MKKPIWITPKKFVREGNQLFYFRKAFELSETGEAVCKISAQSRYKLYINGFLCAVGPCKGTRERMYVDTVNVTEYLKKGQNEILVEVLRLTPSSLHGGWAPVEGVMRNGTAALYFELKAANVTVHSNGTWRCAQQKNIKINPVNSAAFTEIAKYTNASELKYGTVKKICDVDNADVEHYWWGITSDLFLSERPIPNLSLTEHNLSFDGEYFDASYITFGFPRFKISGKGTVRFYYFECFGSQNSNIKADRCDKSLGYSKSFCDTVTVDGEYVFEPFWFRTFRYIALDIGGNVSVKLEKFLEVNYPMQINSDYDFGRSDDNALFEISVNTLRRCMHETYEDCPYYEQLQYAMDTSLQMIFNYQLTDDDRLARKAMDDFAQAQHADGLMPSRYPCISDQHIPTFQLYFIFMVYSHYIRFGDISLVRKHLRAIDGIIEWFSGHITDKGLVGQSKYWNFIDWAKPWIYEEKVSEGGVPLGVKEGVIGIYNPMLAYFLTLAAKLNLLCGRSDVANEYESLAEILKKNTEKCFYDKKRGMYADDKKHRKFSQHMQTWCVLSGIATGDRARTIMMNSLSVEAKSTYAFAYMYFRALEVCGLYEYTEEMMQSYRNLLKLNCTTVPETPTNPRSECHAWGAVAIYEFCSVVLGVRTENTFEKSISVKPYIKGRDFAKGTVCTIGGRTYVSWKRHEDVFEIEIENDTDNEKVVYLPNGDVYKSKDKKIKLTCNITQEG